MASRTNIQADPQFLTTLARVGGEMQQVLPASEQAPIRAQISNLVNAVQQGNGTITGDAYQALTRAGTPLQRATQSADPNVRFYAGQVRDALDGAFARSARPGDQAALQQARGQYRAMKTIEDLAEKSPDGNIAPAQLLGQVRAQSARFDGSTSGIAYTGGGDLGELARIGQQFMRAPPNSGTADRSLVNTLLLGQGGTLGAVATGAVNPLALAAGPAGLIANRAVGTYLRSPGYANRMIQSSLNPSLNQLTGGASPYAVPVGTAGYNALLRSP